MDTTVLEEILEHEAAYSTFAATLTRTPSAWYLDAPDLPDLRDGNRALRLREDGRGPEAIAHEVIAHFRSRDLAVVAELDPVAERQGIGAALRHQGVMPLQTPYLLMRYSLQSIPALPMGQISVEIVPHELAAAATQEWIEMAISDETETEERALWRAVAEREVVCLQMRHYLARWEGHPAGACVLFSYKGWGRVEEVATHPDFRRRGVASTVVSQAVSDSLTDGNYVTYLWTQAGGAGEKVYERLGFSLWATDVLRRHLG